MAECEAKERKILVGVDEGEESMYALSWCLNNILVSQNSKDTLILLYAKPPRPFYMALDGTNRREVRGHMFSTNVMATMDKYTNELAEANIMATMDKYTDELAESVIEKAKMLCKEIHHLDYFCCAVKGGDEGGNGRSKGCDLSSGGEIGCRHGSVGKPRLQSHHEVVHSHL
ncbi:hypothetical protein HYC85_004195 [Camellia sinensis]|uniref:UspA domain-containing protein n=1 Tax=Camellia sinensis TaxID=4442 RepID=A0A7J7HVV0_CAMSI|nr:hypothetical protein HYC85_004195 [Camellia sinensis]